jgi:plasmid stabilization system protein ParE
MMPGRSSTGNAVCVLVLEWRATARADLLSIVDYISDDNPDAAQHLKDEIETKVSNLREHPKLYRPGRLREHERGLSGGITWWSMRRAPGLFLFCASCTPPGNGRRTGNRFWS